MFKKIIPVCLVICTAALYLHAQTPATQPAEQKRVTPSGLTIIDGGGGDWVSQAGDTIYVHYTGKLQSGETFDSSLTRNEPISIVLGQGQVIKGWDEGLVGMKLGEKRHLIIPPTLGYGEQGAGGKIPPNATLEFDVQMMGIVRGAK